MADEPAAAATTSTDPVSDQTPLTATSKKTVSQGMHVKVYAPFKIYFDDTAHNISAVNDTGPFDILPRHHNFMTLLSAGDIVVRHDGGEEKIKIQRGIMHVKADEVIVFLDV
jgi:F0F1-type ATP synthase epsilon subunit